MDTEIISAKALLEGSGITILDAARIVRNLLDKRDKNSGISPLKFCIKAMETGACHVNSQEMTFADGFARYLKEKSHLRKDSLRDLRYLGTRLLRRLPQMKTQYFSHLSRKGVADWLDAAFTTPSQYNKGRAFLHALFEHAVRQEWCAANPVRLIPKRKVLEREITPLSLAQVEALMRAAAPHGATAAAGLLIFAGIRPREVRRLEWADIDLAENAITIRPQCSKTGGARQVEICPRLHRLLRRARKRECRICPKNWQRRWRRIRKASGFPCWTPDVLRHTYASYHAKRYRNLPRLQLNMGHRDCALLRARYVNLRGLSHEDTRAYFAPAAQERNLQKCA